MYKSSYHKYLHSYKVKLIGPRKKIEVQGIIDTGAQRSTVSRAIIQEIGIETGKHASCFKIRLVNGSSLDCAEIKLIAEGKKITLMPIVWPESPVPLILGMDFLEAVDYLPLYIKEFSRLYKHIQKLKGNCVLILGSYGNEDKLKTLEKIKDRLKKFNYEGILLRDYIDIEEQTSEEKMNLFGHLTKFVICENSYPSGHIDELNICTRNRIVTVILQQEDKIATWMQICYPVDFSFVKIIKYKPSSLIRKIDEAIRTAESLVAERTRQLNQLYIHRKEWLGKLR